MSDDPTHPAPCQAYPDPLPGLIPFGSLSILIGPPKRGKTALVAEWCARWRDGRTICGLPTGSPTALGIFTTDHKWHLNQGPWFAVAGFADIRHYALRDLPDMPWRALRIPAKADDIFDRGLDALALPPGSLVVVDVIGPFITSRLNDYAEVVGGLGTISQKLDRRGLTGLCLSHMGKQKGDTKDQYRDPFERILGSGAQIGFSDTLFYLLGPKDLEQPYYEVGWQPTHAPSGTFRFKRDAFGLFVPYARPEPLAGHSGDYPTELESMLMIMPADLPGWKAQQLLIAVEAACGVKRRRAAYLVKRLLQDGQIVRKSFGIYVRAKPH